MDQDTRQANVVLTADTSGYNQSLQQSASATDQFNKGLDGVLHRLSDLSRAAGKKLLLFSAADLAGIGAATAAYASYEHQMNGLNAQAAVLNRTLTDSQNTFRNYGNVVNNLRNDFPTTTAAAAELVSTLSKFSQFTGSGTLGINAIANVFMKAQGATQEAASGIAQGMLQLQQTMGTTSADTGKFTDQVVTLAARSQTSATSLLQFANSLSPIAKAAGMTQTEVMGVSAAFARAGQDGYQAANAFSGILGNVTRAIATGSPDLAKYSALLGMTTDSFKQLGAASGTLDVLKQISTMGNQGVAVLNQLGFDGIRQMRAIQAVVNQPGGLSGAIGEATSAYGNGATNAGAGAGYSGLSNEMAKLGEQFKMFGENVGKNVEPAVTGLAKSVDGLAQGVNTFLAGPGGKLIAWGSAVVAGLAGVTGGMLSIAGPLLMMAGVSALVRNPLTMGMRSGFTGSTVAGAERLATPAGEAGAGGNFVQRGMYRTGMFMGGGVSRMVPSALSGAGISPLRMMAALPMRAAGMGFNLAADAMSPLGYGMPMMVGGRTLMDGRIPFASGMGVGGFNDPTMRASMIKATSLKEFMGLGKDTGAGAMAGARAWALAGGRNPEAALAGLMESAKKAGVAMSDVGASGAKLATGFGRFTSSLMSGTATLGMMAGRGLGMAAGGMMAFAKENPFMLAMMGMMVAPPLISALSTKPIQVDDQPAITSSYAQSAGQSLVDINAANQATQQAPSASTNAVQVRQLTPNEIAYDTSPGYVFNDDKIKNFSGTSGYDDYKKIIGAQMTYMQGMSPQAMSNIVNDTTKQFGVAAGRNMAQFLTSGQFDVDYTGIFGSLSGPNADTAASQLQSALGSGVAATDATSPLLGARARASVISNLVGTAAASAVYTGGGGLVNEKQVDAFSKILDKYIPGADLAGVLRQTTPDTGIHSKVDFDRAGGGPVDDRTEEEKKQDALTAILKQAQGDDKGWQAFVDSTQGLVTVDMTPEAAADALINNQARFTSLVQGTRNNTLQLLKSAGGVSSDFLSVFGSQRVASASTSADPSRIFRTGENIYTTLRAQGLSNAQIIGTSQQAMSSGFTADSPQYQMYQLSQQLGQQNLQASTMFAPRNVQFATQAGAILHKVNNIDLSTDASGTASQTIQDATSQMNAMKQQYGSFYQQIAMAEMNYQVQKSRAEQDFAIQRDRMEEEYNISRSRAEEDYQRQRQYQEQDFNISKERAQESYDRSVHRSTQDYYISRKRAEEDFQHQSVVMVEQAASSMYDVYTRVTNQRTVSASSLMINMKDQLELMHNQTADLSQLRGMGLSNRAIQMLGLNDPKNAQELARFMTDIMNDPSLIQQFNSQVKMRMKAAGDIMKDPSNMDWHEFVRQFNLSRERGEEDFKRSMSRAHRDFEISMHQSEEDYQRQMSRQADMFQLTMDRQEEDYNRTVGNMEDDMARQMQRAADDLNRMATEISGSFPEIIHKALKALNGANADEARDILKTFRNLRDAILGEADKVNIGLADKWGISLKNAPNTAPASGAGTNAGGGDTPPQHGGPPGGGPANMPKGRHSGTPPVQKVDDSTDGLQIFFPLPAGSYSVGTPFGEPGPWWASGYHTGQDFPAPEGTPIEAIMDGHATFAGWSSSESYGNETRLFHGKNQRNQTVETLYGHQSKIIISGGDPVMGGEHIGDVGWTGNVVPKDPSGSHLHLELLLDGQAVDPMQLFDGQTIHLHGSDVAGSGPEFNKQKWLSRMWPAIEKAAAKVGIAGGIPYGAMSKRFDQASFGAIKKYAKKHGMSLSQVMDAGGQRSGVHNPGNTTSAPSNPTGNTALGKSMAASRGWTGDEWDSLYQLWTHESGWDETADNHSSSAYGIPQHLLSYGFPKGYVDHITGSGSSIQGYGGDPRVQIHWGLNYIKNRYGDPNNAWDFWQANNWYGEGGIFNGPQTIGVGERGPEIVLPLDARGAQFIASLSQEMRSANMGVGSAPMRGCSHYSYQQIDSRTQFLGDITVPSNDPNDFITKMKLRKRAQNLTQPTLASR